jgi:apolipoprotein N-acyltransferase
MFARLDIADVLMKLYCDMYSMSTVVSLMGLYRWRLGVARHSSGGITLKKNWGLLLTYAVSASHLHARNLCIWVRDRHTKIDPIRYPLPNVLMFMTAIILLLVTALSADFFPGCLAWWGVTEWLRVQAKLGPHWGSVVWGGVTSLLGLTPPPMGDLGKSLLVRTFNIASLALHRGICTVT